ncbi:MAG: glycine cleavage system aminomethyltransferase GcvT, partial [Herbaspirillum sp.]
NNIDKLQLPGKALYSCLLNPTGGVIDDLIVYFFAEDWFRLVVNAGTAETDISWINAQNQQTGSAVQIIQRGNSGTAPVGLIAVQGPNARAKVWQVLPSTQVATEDLKPFNALNLTNTEFGDLMLARTGYTGEDGFEIALAATQAVALWQALEAVGVQPAGLGARDTLRLEAGMNLYGQDMDGGTNPLDTGLGWTVDMSSERDFIGRAALLANGQRTQLVGLVLREKGGVLRAHQTVSSAHGDGVITSGTFSPTLQQAIALARLPLSVAVGDTVQVDIRGKKLAASVIKLPFVRHGKILVS